MVAGLQTLMRTLVVAEPTTVDRLQVFGVRWADVAGLDYVTLDEALATGAFEVTEVDEGGTVPVLRVTNSTDHRVFLMAGEELIGAKQNRVLNASILVEAHSKTEIPVSCVEQGRWRYNSRRFRSAGSSSHSRLRALMSRAAFKGYLEEGKASSDQGKVWSEVLRKLKEVGSSSGSAALHQAFIDRHERLNDMLSRVSVPRDCSGVVFAFGGRVAGLDMFDRPETLTKLLPKLVRSYAIDAIMQEPGDPLQREAVADWVHSAESATFERFESAGLGHDVRVEAPQLVGAGLVAQECPVHVELFPEECPPKEP